jgi:hypothetical protein
MAWTQKYLIIFTKPLIQKLNGKWKRMKNNPTRNEKG